MLCTFSIFIVKLYQTNRSSFSELEKRGRSVVSEQSNEGLSWVEMLDRAAGIEDSPTGFGAGLTSTGLTRCSQGSVPRRSGSSNRPGLRSEATYSIMTVFAPPLIES